METADYDRMLVESIIADEGVSHAVDFLLSTLLAELPGYSSRATDGVLFEYWHLADGKAMARGIVVMIAGQKRRTVASERRS